MRNWTYARKFVFKKFWVRGKGEGGKEEGVVVERGAKSENQRLEAGAEKVRCSLIVI